jgi:hypothetical protein
MRASDTTTRRTLLGAAVIAIAWAVALHMTGGIIIETSWRPLTSRNVIRPAIAAAAMIAWYLAAWRRHWREDFAPLARLARPHVIGGAATITALVVGLGWGATLGAGPDPSGYVSQAAMLARGELTQEAPQWAQTASWDDAAYSSSPVGWHPTTQTHILAPTYSLGLPLLMAMTSKIAGSEAIFYVVPLLGTMLIAATYLLGAQLGGPWAGAAAAVLMVSSPTFLALHLRVMSDVPVAAFWTVAVAAALHGGRPWLAGTAAAIAILVRPNLVPLVVVPLLLVLKRDRIRFRLLAFGFPVGFACGMVATINWYYHGSPLISGYGSLENMFSSRYIWPNVKQYSRWFVETHTPIALLGLAAAFVAPAGRARVAVITLGIPAALLAFYLPFFVFPWWDWGYTRFLLPSYPAIFVGCGVVAAAASARATRPAVANALIVVAIAIIAANGWTYAISEGVFTQRLGDARYSWAIEYAKKLPERSIVLSNAHSGTLRFYAGRDVIRFEAIRARDIDRAKSALEAQGYTLFFIGDEFELDEFRTLFAGTRTIASLPKKPRAQYGGVVVYDIPSR